MNFLTILILVVISFLAGFVTSFFVMRNNPKYFNVDKMLKKMRDEKKKEFIDIVDDWKRRVGITK